MNVCISCCAECITAGLKNATNDTLYFMATLNQTLTCFEKYQQVLFTFYLKRRLHCEFTLLKLNHVWLSFLFSSCSSQGNHTELCKNCKSSYKNLNELYSRMENNQTLCIDIEDAVRTTDVFLCERRLHPLEEPADSKGKPVRGGCCPLWAADEMFAPQLNHLAWRYMLDLDNSTRCSALVAGFTLCAIYSSSCTNSYWTHLTEHVHNTGFGRRFESDLQPLATSPSVSLSLIELPVFVSLSYQNKTGNTWK